MTRFIYRKNATQKRQNFEQEKIKKVRVKNEFVEDTAIGCLIRRVKTLSRIWFGCVCSKWPCSKHHGFGSARPIV